MTIAGIPDRISMQCLIDIVIKSPKIGCCDYSLMSFYYSRIPSLWRLSACYYFWPCPEVVIISYKGPSIYDVRKILGFFGPLPPCSHLGLIYNTKLTSLTTSSFGLTPLPLSADVIYGCPLSTVKQCEIPCFKWWIGRSDQPIVFLRKNRLFGHLNLL